MSTDSFGIHSGYLVCVFSLHIRMKYSINCCLFSRTYIISSMYTTLGGNTPYATRRISRTKPPYGKRNIFD